MKIRFGILLALLLALLTLVACDDADAPDSGAGAPPAHTHAYGSYTQTVAPTCGAAGEETATCSCGAKKTRAVAATGAHGWSGWSTVTAATCTTEGALKRTCSGCGVTEDGTLAALGHNWNTSNGCTRCQAVLNYTQGLAYTLNADEDGYIVSGLGTVSSPTAIVLPAYYAGLPVTEIKQNVFANCATLQSVVLPDTLTTIGRMAFGNCTSLSSLTLSRGLTTVGPSAFYGCAQISSLHFSDALKVVDTAAFQGCTSLSSLTFDGAVDTISSSAFKGCTALTEVSVDANQIGSGAFADCTALAKITLMGPLTGVSGAALTNTAFYNTASNWTGDLLYIDTLLLCARPTIAGAVTVPAHTTAIAGSAFLNCGAMTSVDMSGAAITYIGSAAFSTCGELVSVTLPTTLTRIESSTFTKCSKLTTVQNTAQLDFIGANAFNQCSKLPSFHVGEHVTTIEKGAFANCHAFSSMTFAVTTGWYRTPTKGAATGSVYPIQGADACAQNFRYDVGNYYYRKTTT